MSKRHLTPAALAALAGILLIAAALGACGEDPDAPWTPNPDRTMQFLVPAPTASRFPVPTATTGPTATPAPTPTLVAYPEEIAFAVTTRTTWRHAFSNFSGIQQECIEEGLGQPQLDSFLRKTIMSSHIDDYSSLTVSFFSCLDPRWAKSLFVAILAIHLKENTGLDIGETQVNCLLVWARGKNVPSLLANKDEVQRMMEEVQECVPELSEKQDKDPSEETITVLVQENENLLEAHSIEPYLIGNLLFIAHWDEDAQHWLVHDIVGQFTPDQLTPPPGMAIPPNPEIGILNELEPGKLYDFHVRSDQIVNIVEGETGDWYFNAGANFIEWLR